MSKRILYAATLCLLASWMPAQAQAEERLELLEPGQPMSVPEDSAEGLSPPESAEGWYSISLRGARLELQRAEALRPSDWLSASASPAVDIRALPASGDRLAGHALVQAADALLGVRLERDQGAVALPEGAHDSLAPEQALGVDTRIGFTLGETSWDLYPEYQRRPDGALLAGSMKLVLDDRQGTSYVALPPAHGMAFSRQELLWLGDLDRDQRPDLLLRRTSVTGSRDLVLVMGEVFAVLTIDPDRPGRSFSSGADDSMELVQHRDGPTLLPPARFGSAAFSISAESWQALLDDHDGKTPKTLADRQLQLTGERLRFTLEYLPRSAGEGVSSASDDLWEGDVLLRVYFRGRSQVLLQPSTPDGSPFAVTVGTIDDQPAIRVDYYPHYNNAFAYWWILDETGAGRFRRLLIEHSQGC